MQALSDQQLTEKTDEFKQRFEQGESLDDMDVLPPGSQRMIDHIAKLKEDGTAG